MSTSQTVNRFITILLLLAGLMLLRKPIFGQAIPTVPTRFSVVVEGVGSGKGTDVILIPGLSSSRDVFAAEAKFLTANYRLHLVQIAGFAGDPAGPNATGPILTPVVEQLHQYIIDNKLQHPAIIGHSLGGLLAPMLAQAHPEDVSKLLIIDSLPFYALVFAPEATVDVVKPQAAVMRDQIIGAEPDVYAAMAIQTSAILVLNPDARKLVAANSIASDRRVMADASMKTLRPTCAPNSPPSRPQPHCSTPSTPPPQAPTPLRSTPSTPVPTELCPT
jgi:pimeloyl-ACP methyl ester carboxylesterase